jgi:formylglycine-generating enzyme required for sulfatase activity
VRTDAPVPQFGDRLLVEVLDDEGISCDGCRRIFDVSRSEKLPLTFGVTASPSGRSPRVRVRFHRTAGSGADGTPTRANIDALARLPPLGTGILRVVMDLRMDCFGVTANVAAGQSCDPTTRALAPEPVLAPEALPLEVGSWPGAVTVPCSRPAPERMICVPGGAFLLGAPQDLPISDKLLPYPELVVRVSPFALDEDELTVGVIRDLVKTKGIAPPFTRSADPGREMCTYLGPDDGANDALPVNCLTWAQAERACAALGKRLPTEAEWEWAAGNREAETTYPWGENEDVCAHTRVASGRLAEESEAITCRPPDGPPGPLRGGHEKDVTALGVRNLSGNLSEWVLDVFDGYAAACWQNQPIDPVCRGTSSHAVRGGSWRQEVRDAKVYTRGASQTDQAENAIGFRCATPL